MWSQDYHCDDGKDVILVKLPLWWIAIWSCIRFKWFSHLINTSSTSFNLSSNGKWWKRRNWRFNLEFLVLNWYWKTIYRYNGKSLNPEAVSIVSFITPYIIYQFEIMCLVFKKKYFINPIDNFNLTDVHLQMTSWCTANSQLKRES